MKGINLIDDDENIKETIINDSIGRNAELVSFIQLLMGVENSCSIALDGKWGTGKTFFVKQVKMVLDSLNTHNPRKEQFAEEIKKHYERIDPKWADSYQPLATVYYDAWQHDDEEDPLLSLLYEIMQQNVYVCNDVKKRDWTVSLTSVVDAITNLKITDVVKNFKGESIFKDQKENASLSEVIKNILSELREEIGNKLVLFIDELDRCSPEYAVKLLERIKHYFICEDTIFVFSTNLSELQHTIKNYYGFEFDACKYLDRFFDMRIGLLPVNMENYMDSLPCTNDNNQREKICLEVIKQLGLGMREASKLIYLSKVATNKYYKRNNLYGESNQKVIYPFMYNVMVPVAIGLKITDDDRFNKFISGIDSSFLESVVLSCPYKNFIMSGLISEKESYEPGSGKIHIPEKNRIIEIYNAILKKEWQKDEVKAIGGMIFIGEEKTELLKAVNLLSYHTDYTI